MTNLRDCWRAVKQSSRVRKHTRIPQSGFGLFHSWKKKKKWDLPSIRVCRVFRGLLWLRTIRLPSKYAGSTTVKDASSGSGVRKANRETTTITTFTTASRLWRLHSITAAHAKATLALQPYSLFCISIASGKHPCFVASFFSWIFFVFCDLVIYVLFWILFLRVFYFFQNE